MNKENLPQYSYGQQVYIKKGFYKGHKAEIKEYKIVSIKNQETEEEEIYILYNVKMENTNQKGLYEVKEEWLIPYRKYILF